MNEVERIYRLRDQKIERGEIHIILPEEEHRKHQKDGTFPGPGSFPAPTNEFEAPYLNGKEPSAGQEPGPTRPSLPEEPAYPTPGFQSQALRRDENETDRYCICGKQNDNQ